jgi:hypothetical protein
LKGQNPLARFSLPARIVVIASIFAGGAGTAAYVRWLLPGLPTGSYPLWFFAFPVAIVVALLCGVGFLVLCACGVRICHPEDDVHPAQGNRH